MCLLLQSAHAIGDRDREKFLPALPALFEAGASVEEALETAVLSDGVDAAGICVSYAVDPERIVEMSEARAAKEADRKRAGLGDEHGIESEEDEMEEEETWPLEMESFLWSVNHGNQGT